MHLSAVAASILMGLSPHFQQFIANRNTEHTTSPLGHDPA